MKTESFIYNGKECVRQLICFSQGVRKYGISKDAPIIGVVNANSYENSYRQLNAEIRPDILNGLVKFWTAVPSVRFRFLVISFQKYIGQNADKYRKDENYRKSVTTLLLALFQQILIDCNSDVIEHKPLAQILRVSAIQHSEGLATAFRKFDIPYQKSVAMQKSGSGFIPKNISDESIKEFNEVVSELLKLVTIKLV